MQTNIVKIPEGRILTHEFCEEKSGAGICALSSILSEVHVSGKIKAESEFLQFTKV